MRPRAAWDLSLASVLQIVQVVALLCALVYWFFVNANRGLDNERQLADLKTGMQSQLAETRQMVAAGLTDVHQQIVVLPDQRARLDQMERRVSEADARYAGADARLVSLERQLIELRADLNAITRASNVPLPGRR
jgi:chromosome segregation ATPase